jgi:hypothetical protein
MIAAMACRSPLAAFGPILAHAMKVVPLTPNHNVCIYATPAGALSVVQYRPVGAGRGGTAT